MSPQLRLVNTQSHCEGTVEIFYYGSWGTICDDKWDLNDAQVVCRQLGCGVAIEAKHSAFFGVGSGPIWLNEVTCTGKESNLGECIAYSQENRNCGHNEDAGVICSGMVSTSMLPG